MQKLTKQLKMMLKGQCLKLRMYMEMYNNQKEKSLHSTVLISFEI